MKALILALTILSAVSATNRTEYYNRYGTVIRHNRNSGLTTVKDKQGMLWWYFSEIPVQTGKKVKMTMYTNNTTDCLDDWVVDVEW